MHRRLKRGLKTSRPHMTGTPKMSRHLGSENMYQQGKMCIRLTTLKPHISRYHKERTWCPTSAK